MSITDMEHVLVLSDEIETTREFYCQVVGLRVGERPALEFPGYWLYAGATACLHIAERGPYLAHAARLGLNVLAQPAAGGTVPTQAAATGPVDHIAFNADDYDELRARCESRGVPAVANTIPGGGPRQLFIDDPNGVRIEINVRHSPT
jgi:catechol 2,3-dioxygenase-like lactoylglutathione lyase family enzyme